MRDAVDELKRLGIPYEVRVVSAHRTPELMFEYAKTAVDRGLEVIIAGAGGAAHLPGMTASLTPLPVIGVPIMTKQLNGIDSLLSIVQMPYGTPVATVAINGARNAALLAARILGIKYPEFRQRVVELMDSMRNEVMRTVLEDA
jgi:5-(carboxyamino)imidazole ribonucleotide mutase